MIMQLHLSKRQTNHPPIISANPEIEGIWNGIELNSSMQLALSDWQMSSISAFVGDNMWRDEKAQKWY